MRNQMDNSTEDQTEKFFDIDGIIGTGCAIMIVLTMIALELKWI